MAQGSNAGAGSLAGKPCLNHPSTHRYEEQLSPGRPNLHLRQTQYVPPGQCHGTALSLPMSPPMLHPSASPSSSTFCFSCCQNATQSHMMPFSSKNLLLISYHHQPCRLKQLIPNKLMTLLRSHFNLLHIQFLLQASIKRHLSTGCDHVPKPTSSCMPQIAK